MNTHVFVVDSRTIKMHIEHLFAGTGAKDKQSPFLLKADDNSINANTERNLVGLIADISRIRRGDNIIFYLQASGKTPGTFFGIFKAESIGFFDENDEDNYLKEELSKGLSYRIKISPKEVFSCGITEHEYLDDLSGKQFPYQLCWSLIYRKLKGNRGCTMITEYEYIDLYNKLKYKNNGNNLEGDSFTFDEENAVIKKAERHTIDYVGRQFKIDITERLLYKKKRGNAFEAHLQAYILQNFDKSPLKDVLGIHMVENTWIGNEVSCGVGMQRIDLLLIETEDDIIHIRIVELKDEEPYDYIITNQLPWYLKWVSDYIVPAYLQHFNKVYLHPCIIAKQTTDETMLDKIKNKRFNFDTDAEICMNEYISFQIADRITFKKEI